MEPYFANIVSHCSDFFCDAYYKKSGVIMLVWYKYQWRKIIGFKPNLDKGKDASGYYKEGLVHFEGLTPRRIQAGVKMFMVHSNESILRDVKLHQFWFQKKGPQIEDLKYYIHFYSRLYLSDFREK